MTTALSKEHLSPRVRAAVRWATGVGKRRWQRFYAELHQIALRGLGYGADTPTNSGETALLAALASDGLAPLVIFDVGANVGSWSLAAASTWPAAQVHAFEPASGVYQQLVAKCGSRNITCVNAALSDVSGEALLHSVPGRSGLSSLHERDLAEHGLRMSSSESVTKTTLDQYCRDHALDHVDMLKIDTEGHDLAVLLGARKILQELAISLIQFEFGGSNIDSRTYLRDFVRLLDGAYEIYHVLVDGIAPLVYTERQEIFVTRNFLAVRRDDARTAFPAGLLRGYGREAAPPVQAAGD